MIFVVKVVCGKLV
ncbi:hypothetical protein M2H07_22480 [Vibrio vulnificus]|nr:hypothetical protein [Vibrio vulnificus]MCU8273664.1 hypothetical protein [Vibrio vulnificus]MCU8356751.1 hypothetical protein [Vibrio vulnificus]MCU8361158.1 hypothetical protein [Vibrio vulnificus]